MEKRDSPRILTILLHSFIWLQGVASQTVTLESPSPHPTCPNQLLIYNCQLQFLATFLQWSHPQFGSLGFIASARDEGDMENRIDNRVVANLTMNEMNETDSGLYMMASALTIYPPLNMLDGSNLNGTVLTCSGSAIGIMGEDNTAVFLTGKTSPPHNLRNATPDDPPFARIEWDPPVYTGGNGTSIQKYRIRIPEINYSEEEIGTVHSIEVGSRDIKFNTPYEVEVTAINTCENESDPQLIAVNVRASGPPVPFLSATLMCNVGSQTANLAWMYATETSTVYTPPIDTVTVNVVGPDAVSANKCSDLTQSDMNCSFAITKDGMYTVTLTITNVIGTSINSTSFDSTPLQVDDSPLTDADNPHILVTVNTLCQDDDYTVTVVFGTRSEERCEYQKSNITKGADMVSSADGQSEWRFDAPKDVVGGNEYCYFVELRNDQGVIDFFEEDGGGDGSSGGGGGGGGGGFIIGLVCGLYFGLYGGVVSGSASNIYWILPLVAGLSGSLVVLMAVGMITSIAVFPIGIVLLIVTCCCCREKKSGNECYDSSYHNETLAKFLFYLGIVTSIIIFPLVIVAVLLYLCKYKYARCVVISFGITGAVMVFPIGLVLLFVSCCCCRGKESDDRPPMQFQDLSNCHKALVYIGGVVSAIILPLGIVIFVYHHCSKSDSKDKDDQEMKKLSGSSIDPESPPPTKEPPPTGPMYQDPSTIQHQPHPETGEMYAVIQESSKKKKKKKGEEPTGVMYQDPQSIEHQQAESGDMYAVSQKEAKKKKKGKKGEEPKTEEELAQMYSTVDKDQKKKSEGLVYADLDVHSSSAKPPPSQLSEYADIKH